MLMMTESFSVLEESISMFAESFSLLEESVSMLSEFAFILEESYLTRGESAAAPVGAISFSMGTNVFSRESWTKEFASVAKSSVVYNSLLLQAQSRANKIQQIPYIFFTYYSWVLV